MIRSRRCFPPFNVRKTNPKLYLIGTFIVCWDLNISWFFIYLVFMRLIARDVFGLPTLCVCDIRYGFFVFKISHRIHVKMEKQNFRLTLSPCEMRTGLKSQQSKLHTTNRKQRRKKVEPLSVWKESLKICYAQRTSRNHIFCVRWREEWESSAQPRVCLNVRDAKAHAEKLSDEKWRRNIW